MKLNRITSLAAVVVAVLIVVGQFVGGAHAAPSAAPAAHYQASGITAQMNPPAQSAAPKSAKDKTARPADQSPLDFSVQGRLTDHSGNPVTSPTAVVFNLYDVASGGTALLTQSATVTPDLNGLFTYVFVVDTTSTFNNVLLFDGKLFLGITVGSDGEMTPRFELTASPYAMSLAPGAQITGNFNYSTNHDNGLFNLYNTNTSSPNSAGLYSSGPRGVWGDASTSVGSGVYGSASAGDGVQGDSSTGFGVAGYANDNTSSTHAGVYGQGPTGVWGEASSSGGSNGYGGYFYNAGGGTGTQDGVYANGATGTGVVGIGAQTGGNAGGDFTGYSGIHSNGDGATTSASNDGVDAGGAGSSSYGYYTTQPSGDANYSFYGLAHIHGSNVSAASYELEVRYHGSAPAQIGDVLALDGNNETYNSTQVLGVVKADANNANAAVGVLAYRLDTSKVNGADKTLIDANATQIKSGDRAYIVIAGQVQMKVSGSVNIGDRVAIASNGSITATKDSANSIGKVASKPDANGMVTIVVNFK